LGYTISVTNIRSLLRLVGYYQKFIEGFLKKIKPITELLGKHKKFKWKPSYEARFRN
jgi:hypothetical protein